MVSDIQTVIILFEIRTVFSLLFNLKKQKNSRFAKMPRILQFCYFSASYLPVKFYNMLLGN